MFNPDSSRRSLWQMPLAVLRLGRPRRALGPAGLHRYLLRLCQRPRPVLFPAAEGNGGGRGDAAAIRPGQRGAWPEPCPCHLASQSGTTPDQLHPGPAGHEPAGAPP